MGLLGHFFKKCWRVVEANVMAFFSFFLFFFLQFFIGIVNLKISQCLLPCIDSPKRITPIILGNFGPLAL